MSGQSIQRSRELAGNFTLSESCHSVFAHSCAPARAMLKKITMKKVRISYVVSILAGMWSRSRRLGLETVSRVETHQRLVSVSGFNVAIKWSSKSRSCLQPDAITDGVPHYVESADVINAYRYGWRRGPYILLTEVACRKSGSDLRGTVSFQFNQ